MEIQKDIPYIEIGYNEGGQLTISFDSGEIVRFFDDFTNCPVCRGHKHSGQVEELITLYNEIIEKTSIKKLIERS